MLRTKEAAPEAALIVPDQFTALAFENADVAGGFEAPKPLHKPGRLLARNDCREQMRRFLTLPLVPAYSRDETIFRRREAIQKQTEPSLSSIDQWGFGYVSFHQSLVS